MLLLKNKHLLERCSSSDVNSDFPRVLFVGIFDQIGKKITKQKKTFDWPDTTTFLKCFDELNTCTTFANVKKYECLQFGQSRKVILKVFYVSMKKQTVLVTNDATRAVTKSLALEENS